jgi:RimJ/RimL family protein N-acetyltransferase
MVPALSDGVIILTGYTDDDVAVHLAGEDEETARRFGWWPQKSTEDTVRSAFRRWALNWETAGPVRAFAARDAATSQLVGGCELRPATTWPLAGCQRRPD